MKAFFSMFLMFTFMATLAAQEQATPVDPTDIEIDGLVFDQTRTRVGRDYYEKFFAKWTAPAEVSGYSIVVEEQPARGRLGYVEMKVDETVVATYNLQPREDWMEEAALDAVNRLTNYLKNLAETQKNLESGDQAGSGIY